MNELLPAAIYTPLGVIITAFIVWLRERHRNKAAGTLDTVQGAKVVQGMALDMLEPLRNKIDKLTSNISTLEHTVATLETEVESLTHEVRVERSNRVKAEQKLDFERAERRKVEQERDHYKLLLGN